MRIKPIKEKREWVVWTSDGEHTLHTSTSLARLVRQIERAGLNILAAVDRSAVVIPDAAGPIKVMVAQNRGPT